MENSRLSLANFDRMSFGCLIDQHDRLVASSFGLNPRAVKVHLVEYSRKTIGKSPALSDHWLTREMIKRFKGDKNPQIVKLNRDFVSTHQRRVCGVLEKIPAGKVTTYGLISNRIVSGPRAVGGAVGSNPWSIFVPCHRVVTSNLTIGNYSLCGSLGQTGSATKRGLLVREEVPVDGDNIDPTALWNPSESD